MILNKQNFENEDFGMGFMHLKLKTIETVKLKIKFIETKI